MGDVRFTPWLERVRRASDPAAEIRRLPDDGVVAALAAASRSDVPVLANVLATEAMNRLHRSAAVANAVGDAVCALDAQGRLAFMNPAAERLLGRARERCAGEPFDACVRLADASARSAVRAAFEEGRTASIEETTVERADGDRVHVSLIVTPVEHDGMLRGAVVCLHDMTQRVRAERERATLLDRERDARVRASRATERLARLQRVTAALVGAACPRDVVDAVVDACATALGASGVVVALRDPSSGALVVRRVEGAVGADLREGLRLSGETKAPVLDAYRSGEVVLLPTREEAVARYPLLERVAHPNVRSFAAAPLVAGGETLGALGLAFDAERAFDERESEMFLAIGRMSAGALLRTGTLDALEESEERLRLVALASNDGFLDWDLERDTVWISQRWKQSMGYDPSEEADAAESVASWARLIDRADRDRAVHEYGRFMESGETFHQGEYRFRRRDGGLRWMRVRTYGVRDREGRLVRMVSAYTDVTSEMRAQELLREREQRFRSLFENFPDPVMAIGTDGRFTDLNEAALRIGGYERDDLVGKPALSVLVPEDVERALARLEAALAGRVVEDAFVGVAKDGSTFRVVVRSVPIVADGRVKGVYGILKEVSGARADPATGSVADPLSTAPRNGPRMPRREGRGDREAEGPPVRRTGLGTQVDASHAPEGVQGTVKDRRGAASEEHEWLGPDREDEGSER